MEKKDAKHVDSPQKTGTVAADERENERKERIELIKKFTNSIVKKHKSLIRSVVLFGSTAREQWRSESDIDIFVILDDTKTKISPHMKDDIEHDFERIAKDLSPLMAIQSPYLLTEFWNMVRTGNPIIYNFVREGVPIYDKDIFLPIKKLLQMGEIKPSQEAVEKYLERAPKRLRRIETSKMYMVAEDCYNSMIESGHAVLMFMGKMPPRPNEAADALRKHLVEEGLLEKEYADWLGEIINIRKEVEHKRMKRIPGQDIDLWLDRTDKFIKRMEKVIVKIELIKRENIVRKSYSIMEETIETLLDSAEAETAKGESLRDVFKKNLVDRGLVSAEYLQIYDNVSGMKKSIDAGKVIDVPKESIMKGREDVRKFIRIVGKVLKK
ncbi:MAG: nucleotidyltransferase domain-containing protein [Candidatus Aenigmarchaeota archaeon]|nr:nucleotidyltransferase domain-containing protein [Candidatus Aenigmarchaeota archaeon]